MELQIRFGSQVTGVTKCARAQENFKILNSESFLSKSAFIQRKAHFLFRYFLATFLPQT